MTTIMTSSHSEEELLAFVRNAAAWFAQNPQGATYGDMAPGELLALRWGLGNDCVRVVRLDNDFTHRVYQGEIKK